jgi:hypothetical protein
MMTDISSEHMPNHLMVLKKDKRNHLLEGPIAGTCVHTHTVCELVLALVPPRGVAGQDGCRATHAEQGVCDKGFLPLSTVEGTADYLAGHEQADLARVCLDTRNNRSYT